MAVQIGIRRYAVVGNKVAHDADRRFLEQNTLPEEYLGSLPLSETIRRADRDGLPLIDVAEPELLAAFRGLWEKVKRHAEETVGMGERQRSGQ